MTIANTILQVKKSATPGMAPGVLNYGELALNYYDGKLYYKNTNGAIVIYANAAVSSTQSFATVVANSSSIVATSSTDTLTFLPGIEINIVTDTSGKTITFHHANNSASPVTYGNGSYIPVITLDAQGHVASVTNTAVAGVTAYNGGTITGSQLIANGTMSTSNSTGASVVQGGIGVSGNAYIGGIFITGNADVANNTANGITFVDGSKMVTAMTLGRVVATSIGFNLP